MTNNEFELVTVWLTTYKNFKYINQSLKSILSQNYPKIELIICDDGSPNFPNIEICNYIDGIRRDNLVQYVILMSDKNNGSVKNVNKVFNVANGKYFIGCTSDDELF